MRMLPRIDAETVRERGTCYCWHVRGISVHLLARSREISSLERAPRAEQDKWPVYAVAHSTLLGYASTPVAKFDLRHHTSLTASGDHCLCPVFEILLNSLRKLTGH